MEIIILRAEQIRNSAKENHYNSKPVSFLRSLVRAELGLTEAEVLALTKAELVKMLVEC